MPWNPRAALLVVVYPAAALGAIAVLAGLAERLDTATWVLGALLIGRF